jgi:hypothetical protein
MIVVLTGLIFGSRAFANASVPLVLVHGANFSGESWTWVQRDLENQGVPLITFSVLSGQPRVDDGALTKFCSDKT